MIPVIFKNYRRHVLRVLKGLSMCQKYVFRPGCHLWKLNFKNQKFMTSIDRDEWIFAIDRWELAFCGSIGMRPLWAWPCRHDLCGRGLCEQSELWQARKGHAYKATPTKASSLWNRRSPILIDRLQKSTNGRIGGYFFKLSFEDAGGCKLLVVISNMCKSESH